MTFVIHLLAFSCDLRPTFFLSSRRDISQKNTGYGLTHWNVTLTRTSAYSRHEYSFLNDPTCLAIC